MINVNFTFNVNGDSYRELQEKADSVIVEFLNESEESPEALEFADFRSNFSIDYDMTITENRDMEVDSDYSAEVTARVKPRR